MRVVLRLPARANGFSGVSSQGLILSALVHVAATIGLLMLANHRPPVPPRSPVTTVMLIAGGRLAPPGRPAVAALPPPPAKQPVPPPPKAAAKAPTPAPARPKPSPPRPQAEAAEPAPAASAAAPPASVPPPAAAADGEPGASLAAGFAPDASGGDPGGVPSIDSAAFPFAYYRTLITNRLRAAWSRPTVPGGLTAPLRATIRFEILRGGALADISLGASSGHPPLDRSALRAAYDANPLPPLPDEFDGDRLAVNFYFELRPEP